MTMNYVIGGCKNFKYIYIGGAMRIPPNHYLTNGYIQKFGIPVRPFVNYNEQTWLYLDGESKIRTKGNYIFTERDIVYLCKPLETTSLINV